MQTHLPLPLLSGIKVLDFGRVISGPFVGQILSDLGADVIKVERPPAGDETRTYNTAATSGSSSLFSALNRRKRSLVLDLGNPKSKAVLTRLVQSTDVLVHNFRPGVVERLGLAPADVWQINQRVVYCSISGFGSSGPMKFRPGNDVIAQAFAGLMSFTGDADGPPVRVPVAIADFTSGLYGAIGVLAALHERNTSGRGRCVETSLVESMLSLECMHIGDYLTMGRLPPKLASGNMLGQPNQAFRTKDGSVIIAVVNDAMWCRCATALGGDALASDPRYLLGRDRLARKDELAEIIEAITARLTSAECVSRLDQVNVLCGPIHTVGEAVNHPHIRSLGILQAFEDSTAEAEVVGSPLVIDGQRPSAGRRAPRLGQDTTSVLRESGFTEAEIESLCAAGVVVAQTG